MALFGAADLAVLLVMPSIVEDEQAAVLERAAVRLDLQPSSWQSGQSVI